MQVSVDLGRFELAQLIFHVDEAFRVNLVIHWIREREEWKKDNGDGDKIE